MTRSRAPASRPALKAAVLCAAVTSAIAGSGLAIPTLDGRHVDPLHGTAKAVILLFTRSDCPISNRYAPEVERLYEKFGPQGLDFWLVYLDPRESGSAVRAHVREYGYRVGVLLDYRRDLVGIAKPEVTPEVAVYVGARMVYRGRIDDRYTAFGQARQKATVHDLEQVLEWVAAGHPPALRTTHAVGCFISDLK